MKVWVTGANGFTGRHLVRQLAGLGDIEVVGIYRTAPNESPAGVKVQVLNLADAAAVKEAVAADQPGQIYHLAGKMPPASAEEMWQSFVTNTYHLLNALRAVGKPTRLLVSGSAAEYLPNDTGVFSEASAIGGVSDYGMAKSAQTLMCQGAAKQFGIDVVIARAFNILGPGMSADFVVGKICQQLNEGAEELVLGNLNSERDFLDVRDIASAYRAIMASDQGYPVVNVCSGAATRIGEMADLACKVYDANPQITSKFRDHGFDIDRAIGDATLLRQTLGWQPEISIEQSLADVRDS